MAIVINRSPWSGCYVGETFYPPGERFPDTVFEYTVIWIATIEGSVLCLPLTHKCFTGWKKLSSGRYRVEDIEYENIPTRQNHPVTVKYRIPTPVSERLADLEAALLDILEKQNGMSTSEYKWMVAAIDPYSERG